MFTVGRSPWIFVIALLLNILSGCGTAPDAEPRYHGKALSQWIEGEASKDPAMVAEALLAMGTNALPHLVRWIAEPSASSDSHGLAAADAFEHLGPTAAPAIPELVRLLDSTNGLTPVLAGTALGYIGQPAVPALMSVYETNRHFRVGTQAAITLSELGTNALPAIPLLLRDLRHENHFYRERAADTLGKMAIEPGTVVPALTNLLTDIYPDARILAMMALADFGEPSRPHAPLVSNLLTDTAPRVREMATNTLRRLFPASAAAVASHRSRK